MIYIYFNRLLTLKLATAKQEERKSHVPEFQFNLLKCESRLKWQVFEASNDWDENIIEAFFNSF